MKNSKLKFKNIGFVLFTAMFFLSVNIMAQQKTITPKISEQSYFGLKLPTLM